MNRNNYIKHLKNAGDDIYYCDDFTVTIPNIISINNKEYFRFCDFILIPCQTDLLTPQQVVNVNKLRAKYYESHPQFTVNKKIRKVFYALINIWKPKTILEFGPGSNPIKFEDNIDIEIQFSDFNEDSVSILNAEGLKCSYFDKQGKLNIENNSIDAIISIFVFQFDISQNQINEMFRVLSNDGIVIANIYKRSNKSRMELLNKFHLSGFTSQIIKDYNEICNQHEYWFFFKNISEDKLQKSHNLLKQLNY